MSALAVAHPRTSPPPRPAHLRPVRDVPAEPPVTVTISIAGGPAAVRDRVLDALRDLVDVAGQAAEVSVQQVVEPPAAGGIRVDPRARTVLHGDRPLDLSRLEFDLLLFLARHPRQVFSRGQLLLQVWGHPHATDRTVDVHVSRLRTKLSGREVVTTVYGLGYRLADDAAIVVL